MVPGIVLAAGASARFAGGHKLLARFGAEAVAYWSVRAALDSALDSVLLVVGHRHAEVVAALGSLVHARRMAVVVNPLWHSGRASSLSAGLRAMPPQATGALVYPADMPLMSAELINAVLDTFKRTNALCFPVYNRRKGHPVAFPRSWFDRLHKLKGDSSAHDLIQRDWERAVKLERTDGQTQCNVNTCEDYEQLLARQMGGHA